MLLCPGQSPGPPVQMVLHSQPRRSGSGVFQYSQTAPGSLTG